VPRVPVNRRDLHSLQDPLNLGDPSSLLKRMKMNLRRKTRMIHSLIVTPSLRQRLKEESHSGMLFLGINAQR